MRREVYHIKRYLITFVVTVFAFAVLVPPKKSHAIAPAAVLLPLAEMLVADVAIDLGVKWVNDQAGKAVTKKLAQEVVNDADDYDFMKVNPKKTSPGKATLPLSPADAARIAGKLAREAADELDFYESDEQVAKRTKPTFDVDGDDIVTDPLYGTSMFLEYYQPSTSDQQKWFHFYTKYFYFKFVPQPYENKTEIFVIGKISRKEKSLGKQYGGFYFISALTSNANLLDESGVFKSGYNFNDFPIEKLAFDLELKAIQEAATEIIVGQQMIFPRKIATNVYRDGSVSYPFVNKLPSRDIEFPISNEIDVNYNEGDEIQYEVLNDNSTQIETYIDTYIDNNNVQNITTTNYNTYNYHYDIDYTDIEQPDGKKVTDIEIDIDNEETPSDGDEPDRESDTLTSLFTKQFPFSLPWDFLAIVDALDAPPVTPHFKIDVSGTLAGNVFPFKVDHKMDYLDPYIPFVHWFFRLSFLFMLVMTTRKILGGGA